MRSTQSKEQTGNQFHHLRYVPKRVRSASNWSRSANWLRNPENASLIIVFSIFYCFLLIRNKLQSNSPKLVTILLGLELWTKNCLELVSVPVDSIPTLLHNIVCLRLIVLLRVKLYLFRIKAYTLHLYQWRWPLSMDPSSFVIAHVISWNPK